MKLKYFLLAAVMVMAPTISLAAEDFVEPALTSDEIIEAALDELQTISRPLCRRRARKAGYQPLQISESLRIIIRSSFRGT